MIIWKQFFQRAFLVCICMVKSSGIIAQSVEKDVSYADKLVNEIIPVLNTGLFSYEEVLFKLDSARQIYLHYLGGENEKYATTFHIAGFIMQDHGKIDSAIHYYEKALNIRIETLGEDHLNVGESYYNLGDAYRILGKYTKSIELQEKALAIRLLKLDKKHHRVATSYNHIGNVYSDMGDYVKAIEFHEKALEIRIESLGKSHPQSAWSYSNLGTAFTQKGDYDKAIVYHKLALEIRLENFGHLHPAVADSYNSLGLNYSYKANYQKALEYHEKALIIGLKTLGSDHREIGIYYNNLGNNYNLQGSYEKAIECHNKALALRLKNLGNEHPDIAWSYLNIGNVYTNKNDHEKAVIYFENCLDLRSKIYGFNHPLVADAYNNLGNAYTDIKVYDKAIELHEKSLHIRLEIFGAKHPYVAMSYLNLGNAYKNKKDYEKALEFFHKALKASGYSEKSNFKGINDFIGLLQILTRCSQTKNLLYEQAKNLEDLIEANELALQAFDLLNYQNTFFINSVDKLQNVNDNFLVYENVIQTSSQLGRVVKNEILRKTIFSYAEKSKASLLQSQIKESDALSFANIPDSLLEKESDLRIDITYYDKKRQEKLSQGLEETDTTVLAISSKIFDLRQQYETLKSRFETDYPDYYRLKYDLSTVSLDYVQDTLLTADQTLLEYFVGDSSIFVFTIKKDDYQVMEIKKDFPLEDWVKQLQNGLAGYYGKNQSEWTDDLFKGTLQDYLAAAPKLYDKLIAPVKNLLTKEVILVPDGVLGYVPFEALLTGKPAKVSDFGSYPFLLNDHQFSYCYSATLLREMKEKRHKKPPIKSLVAFAPFYEDSYATADSTISIEFNTLVNGQDTFFISGVVTRKEFRELVESGEEAATAAKLWGGDYYLNSDATEDRFNEVAGDYRIVHLSTHGIADARVGDYSYLAFAEQKDSIENEFLYVRDLYNTQLNADLVVLSACETAAGELQRGEGIISLARAFAYAGAKSILTTLWVVDDAASKDLTKEFYVQLKKGKAKDEALRLAKRKHLKVNDNTRKHPFFWAAMIGVGDMTALD